jgi:hypothetical protein
MDQLDRDPAAAGRHPEEDLAHAAGSQPAEQPVPADVSRIAALKIFHR